MAEPNPINPLFAQKGTGALSALEESKFEYTELKYPLDIDSNARYRYYMKFNVLMNMRSKYAEQLSFGNESVAEGMKQKQAEFLSSRITKVKNIVTGVVKNEQVKDKAQGAAPTDSTESHDAGANHVSRVFRPQVIKTKQSIRLYMPDTLNWNFQNSWGDVNVQQKMGKAGLGLATIAAGGKLVSDAVAAAAAGSADQAMDAVKNSANGAAGAVIGEAIGGKLGSVELGVAAFGFASNPGVEVLYQSPKLRELQFDFTFAPRNKKEADAAIEIIQMFKFHSAPEFLSGGDIGRYYIPPSQFDIEFYGRDGQIWQLGKIKSQCALTNVNVNYGQSGKFAVFADGTPTNIQLQLSFKEIAFITKEDVEEGF